MHKYSIFSSTPLSSLVPQPKLSARRFFTRSLARSLALSLTSAVVGVAILTGCSGIRPGRLDAVQPVTIADQKPRVGSVYLLRGFIGIFSTGIDAIGAQINDRGIHAEVFQEAQAASLANRIAKAYKDNPNREPLVLVGHSYGADSSIRVARLLAEQGVKVDLIVTLDPVTPPLVPDNISLVVNLYQSNGMFDAMPWLRGIALSPENQDNTSNSSNVVAIENINIRKDRTDLLEPGTDHFNIEKKGKIQSEVIARVLEVCVERTQWAQVRNQQQLASLATRVEGLGDKQPDRKK